MYYTNPLRVCFSLPRNQLWVSSTQHSVCLILIISVEIISAGEPVRTQIKLLVTSFAITRLPESFLHLHHGQAWTPLSLKSRPMLCVLVSSQPFASAILYIQDETSRLCCYFFFFLLLDSKYFLLAQPTFLLYL